MITIIDYGMGNVGSVKKMIEYLGEEAIISSRRKDILAAEKLVLPGVGSFDHGMENLQKKGLKEILDKKVLEEKTPILGICLGSQLLCRRSEEGNKEGLGWIDADVKRISPNDEKLKIPHMGWNYVKIKKENPLTEGLLRRSRFYFVHSYHIVCDEPDDILATTEYGGEIVAAISKDNITGTQFHPEKSHKFGMKIMENFIHV